MAFDLFTDLLLAAMPPVPQRFLHSIDPFKIPVTQAVEKAVALKAYGAHFVLVASTDFDLAFDLSAYLRRLRHEGGLQIVVHFPPQRGQGYPRPAEADIILTTSVLNSSDPYYASLKADRTAITEGTAGAASAQRVIPVAAMVLGEDEKSAQLVGSFRLEADDGRFAELVKRLSSASTPIVYLYRRCSPIDPSTCRKVRALISPKIRIIASGGVDSRESALALLHGGADYVVFGSLLEKDDWRAKLAQMFEAEQKQNGHRKPTAVGKIAAAPQI